MGKSNKAQEYADKTKKEYTVKVTTILKVILVVALMIGSYILGWIGRSDFSNEVRGEVKTQMSAVQAVESVSKTKN